MIWLRGLAFDRKRIINLIDSKSDRFYEHLLKVFYYRNTKDTPGWITEVRAYMGRLPKLKNNSYPEAGFIYDKLWKDWESSFEDAHVDYIEEFNSELTDYSSIKKPSINAKNFCRDYCKWLSEVLSKKGIVSSEEVQKEITLLWSRYPLE